MSGLIALERSLNDARNRLEKIAAERCHILAAVSMLATHDGISSATTTEAVGDIDDILSDLVMIAKAGLELEIARIERDIADAEARDLRRSGPVVI